VRRRGRGGGVGGRTRGAGRDPREGSGDARRAGRRGARPRPAREPRGGRRRPAARPIGGRVNARRVAFHPICRYRRHALTARGKTEPMSTQAGPALLVAQTSFLGDVVLTTPLLTALRERLRPRRLAGLVRPEAAPLLEGAPALDALLPGGKRRAERGLARVAGRLRRERFDLAVSPHRSLRTAIVLAAARIPRRVGFDESRGAFLYHERVHRDRRLHDVQRNLALAEPFAGSSGEPRLHLAVQPAAAARAASLLPEGSGPLVGIAPGSVWDTKRWTQEGFAAVLRGLREQGARVVVLGAASERPIADEVVRLAGGGATVLTGRTD